MFEVLIGNLLGLLGTGVTTIANYKSEKVKNQHEKDMLELSSACTIAEIGANIQTSAISAKAAAAMAEVGVQKATIEEEGKRVFSDAWIDKLLNSTGIVRFVAYPIAFLLLVIFGLLDAVKGAMRSFLTLYCLGLATWISWVTWTVVESQGGILPAEATALWAQVVDTVLILAVTLVTWWFGDKRVAKNLMHQKKG